MGLAGFWQYLCVLGLLGASELTLGSWLTSLGLPDSSRPPPLGHKTCGGKDKVRSQPIWLFTAQCTHPIVSPAPSLPHHPLPPPAQPRAGKCLQHLLPLPGVVDRSRKPG